MPLEDILVHTGRVTAVTRTGPKIEGEHDEGEVESPPFDCVLFLPTPSEEGRGGRKVKRPTLLYGPEDRSGIELKVGNHERLLVLAEETTGSEFVEWQVEGDPQPLGRPGEELVGFQAFLRRVDE